MTWIMVATVTMGVGTAVNVYGQLEAGKAQQGVKPSKTL